MRAALSNPTPSSDRKWRSIRREGLSSENALELGSRGLIRYAGRAPQEFDEAGLLLEPLRQDGNIQPGIARPTRDRLNDIHFCKHRFAARVHQPVHHVFGSSVQPQRIRHLLIRWNSGPLRIVAVL